MLTLNGTQSTNNQVNWMFRFYAQGSNIVTLGDFSASTGWTLSGDWAIGSGVATYNYVDDAAGEMYRTITAVSASSYILSYEITNVDISGGAFVLTLKGAGDYIVGADVALDYALGKHSVVIKGVSGKTKIGFAISGSAATNELTIDNINLKIDDDPVYFSTDELTLDNRYDGQVLSSNSAVTPVVFNSTIGNSGGAGTVTSYSVNISRYIGNTAFNSFFNEFAPATGGGVLLGKTIDIGICWKDSAAADTDITWLLKGRIIEYSFTPRNINLIIFQSSEITNKQIPYYSVQKDFDNGVSYFTNAPDENYDKVLPIIYGDFSTYIDAHSLFKPLLFPLVCVEKHLLRYYAASHKLKTSYLTTGGGTASFLYQFISGLKTYMGMSCDNGSEINNYMQAFCTTFDTLNSTDNIVYGTINIQPQIIGLNNDKTDFSNVVDDSTSTTVVCSSLEEISLRIDGNSGEVGQISRAANSVTLYCVITNVAEAGTLQIGMRYYNAEYNSGAGAYSTGDTKTWASGSETEGYDLSSDFSARDISDEAWRLSELCSLEYNIRAQSGFTVTFQNMWLNITNIVVADIRSIRKSEGGGRVPSIRNSGNGRGVR